MQFMLDIGGLTCGFCRPPPRKRADWANARAGKLEGQAPFWCDETVTKPKLIGREEKGPIGGETCLGDAHPPTNFPPSFLEATQH